MRKLLLFSFTLAALFILSCRPANEKSTESAAKVADTTDQTNDFYDNAPSYALRQTPLLVEGEIKNPGAVDFSSLPKRSVIVKESFLDGDSDKFHGAYRFDGYSLYDILNERLPDKKNADVFNPIIDLYVVVENDEGDKVVFSWGEIFYPIHRHEILIADEVMRIVPSKTKELWPLPENSQIVCASDLITERNIKNPSKITVKSYNLDIPVHKGLKPLYDDTLRIFNENKNLTEALTSLPENAKEINYDVVFYGRGRGIHKSKNFEGMMVKDLMQNQLPFNKENLQKGFIVFSAPDGYRTVFTYSEIFNRNDQSEVLLVCNPKWKDGGIFRIFPSADFFSDRAVKAVNGIYYSREE